MAEPRDNRGRFVKKELADERALNDAYDKTIAQLKEINIQKARGAKIDEEQKQFLLKNLESLKKEIKLRDDAEELVKKQSESYEEVLSIAGQINRNLQKTNSISKKVGDQFNVMTGFSGEIAKNLKDQSYSSKESAAAALGAAKAMESYSSSVATAMRDFKEGNISAESLVDSIKSADENLMNFIDDLDDSNEEIAKLKQGLISATASTKDLSKGFAESKKALSDISNGLEDVASNATAGIPGANGLISALSGFGKAGFIGGVIALGIALAELAEYLMDVYGIAGLYSGQTETQKEMNLQLTKSINGLNRELTEQTFALGQTIKIGGAMKSQMAKLGVSGQAFADATKYTSNNLGLAGKNAQEVGANLAMMSVRTGVSSDQLGSIANTFRNIGNLSGKAAADTLGMAENVAKAAGVPINALFEDLAESSELFLQNNYGNEKSMIRQVATLRVMGVAAQKVLQAGQNMVLNYKDSIKAEMRLSALLGKQVDLSRVRQKFASGDAAGAAQLLRTQLKGVDMDKMNMFQRQALQEATGMDMDTIMKLGKGGKGGKLQTEQEKMAGSIENLGNTLTKVLSQTGVNIANINGKAADTFFAAKVTEEQANKQAEHDKKILDLLDKSLLYLAAIGLALGAGALMKGLFNKLGPKIGQSVAKVFTKKAATTVTGNVAKQTLGATAKKYSQKQILAGFAGKEARDLALKQAGKTTASTAAKTGLSTAASLTDDVAKVGLQSAGKFGFKGIMGGLGKGLMKGGLTGVLGAAASMAGDYFGGQREQQGLAEGDRSKVNQGKALQAGATALEYGGYGAAIGSIVPGIGTAVGGAIGGVVGGIKGIWDGWFSEDAKKKEEQLKQMEIQKEEQAKAIEIQEQLKSQSAALGAAAQDTGFWQSAMIAQLVEATRLLDIIAFASEDEDDATREIYLDGKKITRLSYDRASTLYNAMATQKAAAK